MRKSYSIPSVFEGNNADLFMVAQNLQDGIKLYFDEVPYIVGNLALQEGFSPHKIVNASPSEHDYQIMLHAGLLLSAYKNNRPLVLTTGFPFSTFTVNKNLAKNVIKKVHKIVYDRSTYSDQGLTELMVEVAEVDILPEMLGNIVALRQGETKAKGNFFVVSLGYGTLEAVLSTENGIVQRTAVSVNGLRYAIELFMNELSKDYYLGMKTEKQIDTAFMNNFMIINRKKVDIVDIRRKVLNLYYRDVISPALRTAFTDADFAKTNRMYITGGGALYNDLIENFIQEFDGILHIDVVDNPLTLTSTGYYLHSLSLNGGDTKTAVGLDIGNSNTVMTHFEETAVNQPAGLSFS